MAKDNLINEKSSSKVRRPHHPVPHGRQVVILGLVSKLYEKQTELDSLREQVDSGLAQLYSQVKRASPD